IVVSLYFMKNKTLLSVLALLVISGVFLTACQQAMTPDQNTTTTSTTTENPSDENSATNEQPTPETTASVYKDGDYVEQGSYQSPAGEEKVTVTVRLKGDVVENIDLTSETTAEASKNFQGLFLAGLQQEIVGKNLADIGELTKLNG